MKKLSKVKVLILDDFGLHPITDENKQDLFEIIEDRHGVGSNIVTAQLPTQPGMSIWRVECLGMEFVTVSFIIVTILNYRGNLTGKRPES